MTLRHQDLQLETLDMLHGVDTLCLFVAEDERPLTGASGLSDWRLCGQLSRLLAGGFFTGAEGDSLLLPSDGRLPPGRIVVLGVGRGAWSAARLRGALSRGAQVLDRARVASVALEVPAAGALDEATRAALLQQAFVPAFHGQTVLVLTDRALARQLGR